MARHFLAADLPNPFDAPEPADDWLAFLKTVVADTAQDLADALEWAALQTEELFR